MSEETQTRLRDLLDRQAGVVARHQVPPGAVEAAWAVVHPGVYVAHVAHAGPPTYLQRAWAAVLFAWPAVLCGSSALRIADGPGRRDSDDDVVHVAVERDRAVSAPAGVVVHRVEDLEQSAQWAAAPPRIRVEHALLDVAAGAPDDRAAVAVVCDAVRARRTTAERLLEALDRHDRSRRDRLLRAVLDDLASGSVPGRGPLDAVA